MKILKGAVVECNRCCKTGHIDRDVEAEQENRLVLRIRTMAVVEECGHLDCHWVHKQ